MVLPFGLRSLFTVTLSHAGDCTLLGVTLDGTIYAEEMYSDDGWLAQHHISADGQIIASVDEHSGTHVPFIPLALPDHVVKPARVWNAMALNFSGARHRGLRALERVDAVVHPLSVADKFALVERLKLMTPAPSVIGLAESYVIAEAEVIRREWSIVCRRLRFAYALAEPLNDSDGLPYDYDTRVLHVIHGYQRDDDIESSKAWLDGLPGLDIQRPMDCVIVGDRLYIADGGDIQTERMSTIHVAHIDRPETLSSDEAWHKKLYG